MGLRRGHRPPTGTWRALTLASAQRGGRIGHSATAPRRSHVHLRIKKSSFFLPPLIAATNHRGVAPRPAQVSDRFFGFQYLGATFLPLSEPFLLPPWRSLQKRRVDAVVALQALNREGAELQKRLTLVSEPTLPAQGFTLLGCGEPNWEGHRFLTAAVSTGII